MAAISFCRVTMPHRAFPIIHHRHEVLPQGSLYPTTEKVRVDAQSGAEIPAENIPDVEALLLL